MSQPAEPSAYPPGWYPDPWAPDHHRYWDGQAWSGHSFPDAQGGAWTPPPVGPPADAPGGLPGGPGQPWSPARRFVALLAVVALVVGVSSAIVTLVVLDHRSHSRAAVAPADRDAATLATVVVTQADAGAGLIVAPIPGGTLVAGQTTLDLCNGKFSSESQRTARLQVAAVDPTQGTVLSTEAVLYKNPAATAEAFTQLRAVAAKCPSTPVVSPVGEPTVTTHFNAAPDRAWPRIAGVERLAYDFTATDATGDTQHSMAVYLRRGRLLLGIYLPQSGSAEPPIAGLTSVADIVNLFATRMARVPASVVNR